MDWRAIVFSHEQMSKLEYTKVEDEFQLLFMVAGSPKGMALFALNTFPVHPIYYLTPEAEKHAGPILRKYDSVKCKQPPFEDLELLAGEYAQPLNIQLAAHIDRRSAHRDHFTRLH